MPKFNAANEQIKRKYYTWLREARGQSEATIDQVAASIDRFEDYAKRADFRSFHTERVKAFKEHLAGDLSVRTSKRLSHATIYATLSNLRMFFQWLAGQPGYKQSFAFGDWDYFSPSGATSSIAKARRPSRAPTLTEIRHVIGLMPTATEVERRDRAVIAFIAVTGARVSAVASFQLGHIDIERRVVFQDARDVRTKFRKTFETWFFPIGGDLEQIVVDWVRYLLNEKGWGLKDPLFPSTNVGLNDTGQFGPLGLARSPWSSTGPLREILREAFGRAGLAYPNPHSFRETLAAFGREHCEGLAEMQAWAQNLGHESLTTTFGSYAKVSSDEQRRLVRSIGKAM
ncbi:MAG TPA: site-specific integrase [Xanthobacteraceae bacterium]